MMKAVFASPFAAIACALAGWSLALPAAAQSFNVKPGAWEMTTTMSGNMIPPEALSKMPPERRAMIEKRMEGGNGQTRKSCIRKEDLDQDRFMRSENAECTVKTVSRSATKLVMATTCTGERASTGTMTFESKTPESVVGSIDQDRGNGSRFHIGIVGKWLGAGCEGIEVPPAKK